MKLRVLRNRYNQRAYVLSPSNNHDAPIVYIQNESELATRQFAPGKRYCGRVADEKLWKLQLEGYDVVDGGPCKARAANWPYLSEFIKLKLNASRDRATLTLTGIDDSIVGCYVRFGMDLPGPEELLTEPWACSGGAGPGRYDFVRLDETTVGEALEQALRDLAVRVPIRDGSPYWPWLVDQLRRFPAADLHEILPQFSRAFYESLEQFRRNGVGVLASRFEPVVRRINLEE